ncbi:hypothetical protein MKX08_000251 [Trichoderma sp. CBMAI-0020]|nr:hypothetical protein MKX08_000251 [Trichoderma sp. CBMAI-0020]
MAAFTNLITATFFYTIQITDSNTSATNSSSSSSSSEEDDDDDNDCLGVAPACGQSRQPAPDPNFSRKGGWLNYHYRLSQTLYNYLYFTGFLVPLRAARADAEIPPPPERQQQDQQQQDQQQQQRPRWRY